jgi:hypothetical protein
MKMTPSAPPAPASLKGRRRILDPTERISEVLFGLIMVLTFTGSLSAVSSGREEVRRMLIGALGCNLAWGIIDALFYLMNALGARGRGLLMLKRVRAAAKPEDAQILIADHVLPGLAASLPPEDFEPLRRRLVALPHVPARPPLERDDLLGAFGVFLLVFLSTFPVAIPFLFVRDAQLALRISNGIAIVLLFFSGFGLARYAGYRPWRTGLAMVAIGAVLVAITIALGG